jgi:hypothetical protein
LANIFRFIQISLESSFKSAPHPQLKPLHPK